MEYKEYYNQQDGLKYTLQCRRKGINLPSRYNNRKEFPDEKDYTELFYFFEDKMNKTFHENVNLGAAIENDGLLTDHGVHHINDVIRHLGEIISDIDELTGYEIFVLLLVAHFHDVGNIYGRDEHEQKIAEIMDQFDIDYFLSTPEKQFVSQIAAAHGGYTDGNKDTIGRLSADTKYANVVFRPKVLAALLRFADEISDDLNRSHYRTIKIPVENEVYHEYSKSLEPVSIEGDTICLQYNIPYELTQKTVGKGKDRVFLYDEILARIGKCMKELDYCKKYANSLIKMSSISIKVKILHEGSFRPIKDAGDSFRLTLQGYPNVGDNSMSFYMDRQNGNPNTGKELRYKNGKALKDSL